MLLLCTVAASPGSLSYQELVERTLRLCCSVDFASILFADPSPQCVISVLGGPCRRLLIIYRVSLEGFGQGGIRPGWDQGVKLEQHSSHNFLDNGQTIHLVLFDP